MHRNILLTGGRAPVTLDLARKFAHSGHTVIVAESVPVHLCRYSKAVRRNYLVPRPNVEPIAYVDALINIIQREKIDLLIPTCEEIFHLSQQLDRLSKHCKVMVAPLEQMRRLHSKWEFVQRASQHGLPIPHTSLLTSQEEGERLLTQTRYPFVLKPVFSRFASKVLIVRNQEDFRVALKRLVITDDQPWVAQEFIPGQAYSSYSIARSGRLLAHAIYAEDFTAGRGACINFSLVEHPALERWITHFIEQEDFSGQIAFDFILTADGTVYALECNPRATSGAHLFHRDDQLPRAFLGEQLQPDQVLKPRSSARTMIALAMLFYGLPSIRSWSRFRSWLQIFITAQDVIFSMRDIKPFLNQPLLLWYNWRESRKRHLTMLEFSTLDIEWNGSSLAQSLEQAGKRRAF